MSIQTCVFETAHGSVGLAWTPTGLCGLELFDQSAAAVAARLKRRFPKSLRGDWEEVADLVAMIRQYAAGDPVDFVDVTIDLSAVSAADRPILQHLRGIPHGRLVTYRAIADELAVAGGARQVGQVMGRNPVPLILPCHRVVGSDGRLVGFSGHGGISAKSSMLKHENARLEHARQLSLGL